MAMAVLRKIAHCALARAPVPLANSYYERRNRWRAEAWREAPFFLIHVPKSAGRTVAAAAGFHDPGHVPLSHLPVDLGQVLAAKPCLAVVRDPAERIISTFNYIHTARSKGKPSLVNCLAMNTSLDDFVCQLFFRRNLINHYFFRPASALIGDAQAQGAELRVIPFGAMGFAVLEFLREVGCVVGTLPRENVSTIRIATEADLSPKAAEALRRLYRDDYALLETL